MLEDEQIPAYLIQFAVADPMVNTGTVACCCKPIAADGVRQDKMRAILERTRSFPIVTIKIQAGRDLIHAICTSRRLSHGVFKQYGNGLDGHIGVLQVTEWAGNELVRGGQAKPRCEILESRLSCSDGKPRDEAIDEHTDTTKNAIPVETMDGIYRWRR